MPPDAAPRSLLIKPVSGDCNLHCAYCFYHDRPSDPYREQTRHRMSDIVLEELIRQGMQLDKRQAVFGWQGGEPTLAGLDFFQRVVELQQKHGSPGQVVSNGMQTNGLLLDAEWARLLRRYNFLLGVSLDGPTDFHDHYRTYAHGAPTQEKVLEVTRLLRRYQVEFNVLTVVNRLTAAHGAEVFDYLVAQGYDYLQFIPCVERDPESGALTPFSLQAEEFGDFLCAVFDRWYNGGRPQVSVRDFEAILAVYLGQEAPLCCYQKQCASYLVVEYNGDIYPCDFYVDQAHYIGNIAQMSLEEAFQSEPVRRFAAAKATPRQECQVCAWLPFCHQGCPRFVGVDGPRHYLCRAYQRFFAHSRASFLALCERLLRERGEDPARVPASPEHVPGRNDLCPCGSGKKFKQCCGRKGKTT